MDDKEREAVKQRLEEELAEARDELQRLEEKVQVEVEYGLGEGDPNIYEREMNMALRRRVRRKVRSVEEALQRFEEGTYGVCERCGGQIGAQRLEIMPEARLCINCAQQSGR
jgi:DnaK suppressor protein